MPNERLTPLNETDLQWFENQIKGGYVIDPFIAARVLSDLRETQRLAGELAKVSIQLAIWVDDPWVEDGAKAGGLLCLERLKRHRAEVYEAAKALRAVLSKEKS